jgi:hypothetical protein
MRSPFVKYIKEYIRNDAPFETRVIKKEIGYREGILCYLRILPILEIIFNNGFSIHVSYHF